MRRKNDKQTSHEPRPNKYFFSSPLNHQAEHPLKADHFKPCKCNQGADPDSTSMWDGEIISITHSIMMKRLMCH